MEILVTQERHCQVTFRLTGKYCYARRQRPLVSVGPGLLALSWRCRHRRYPRVAGIGVILALLAQVVLLAQASCSRVILVLTRSGAGVRLCPSGPEASASSRQANSF